MINFYSFQDSASETITQRFSQFCENRPIRGTKKKPRFVPFYQALAAITGAGKTVILADSVERMRTVLPVQPFVLWLSRGKVVVAQTYANLQDGGKYHELIKSYSVHLLSEFRPEHSTDDQVAHLFFATVGTFNDKDRERGDKLIYQADIDYAGLSTWDAIKKRENSNGFRRPLIIVYDEAQNLSDQQTAILLELEPDAFLVASATMKLPNELLRVIKDLQDDGWDEKSLTTHISPAAVAESGLIKNELRLGGYQAPMESTIDDMLLDLAKTEAACITEKADFRPKCIYVCKTNIVEGNAYQRDEAARPFVQREAPPIIIWRYLVEQKGIDPSSIAVYLSLDFKSEYPPPKGFNLFKGRDNDYADFVTGNYQHVIFNLSLQEGWDEPSCYFAYIDKSMGSSVQVQQLIGRLLRQPNAKRYESELLNTANVYVRVDAKEIFNDVVVSVRGRLKEEAPQLKFTAYGAGQSEKPIEYLPSAIISVPKVIRATGEALQRVEELIDKFRDYRKDSGNNTRGEGYRASVQQRIGTSQDAKLEWVTVEHSNLVSARWIFARAVNRLFPAALQIVRTDDVKFDAKVEIGSPAHADIESLSLQVVNTYLEWVRLGLRAPNPYFVGSMSARASETIAFKHSLHSGYAGLNPLEQQCAVEIDSTSLIWTRNPPRVGYGIPLLTKGRSREFYPDFIVFKQDDIFLLDTTGQHLLVERTGRKLLSISPSKSTRIRIYIRLVTPGKWNEEIEQIGDSGATIFRRRVEDGTIRPDHYANMHDAVIACLKPDIED